MGTSEEPAGTPEPFEFEFGDLAATQEGGGGRGCRLLHGKENYLAHHCKAYTEAQATSQQDGARLRELRRQVMQETRALVARWLRMQSLVFLAGAGTSHCAGGKLANGLLESVRTLLEGRPTEATLDLLTGNCTEDRLNFEDFLSYVCAALRCLTASHGSFTTPFRVSASYQANGGDTKWRLLRPDDLGALISDIESAIVAACSLKLPESGASSHVTFIGKVVARDPKLSRAKLVTTNYDTLFEQAMSRLHVLYADGFVGHVERVFDPAVFDLDYYFPGDIAEGRVRRYDKFLHLLKIHGSVDWRKTSLTPENIHGVTWCGRASVTEQDVLDGSADLEAVLGGHCRMGDYPCESCAGNAGLAILPTSAKYGETITMPYSHLFRSFSQALQQPNTVFIVMGYGGWDKHVNRVIADALTNPSFTLVIVDPFPGDWAFRMLDADECERVYAFVGEWAKFDRFATDVLPDMEQLQTQLAVAKQLREMAAGERASGSALPTGDEA